MDCAGMSANPSMTQRTGFKHSCPESSQKFIPMLPRDLSSREIREFRALWLQRNTIDLHLVSGLPTRQVLGRVHWERSSGAQAKRAFMRAVESTTPRSRI